MKTSEKIEVTEKIVVLSDTHFGAVCDRFANEKTDVAGLKEFLDLIVNKIRPKKIILLGDVLDLWRTTFVYAWHNAEGNYLNCPSSGDPKKENYCREKEKGKDGECVEDVQFFTRLSKYVEESKDKNGKANAEVIYVIGNHDHHLKEISLDLQQLKKYHDSINKKVTPSSKIFAQDGVLINRIKDQEEIILTNKIGNLNPWGKKKEEDCDSLFKNICLYYPHYKEEIDGVGTVYFDHGHFSDGMTRIKKVMYWLSRFLDWIIRFLDWVIPKQKERSEPNKSPLNFNAEFEEVYLDQESNLSALYSANFYSKFDDLVRAFRDLGWKFIKLVEGLKKGFEKKFKYSVIGFKIFSVLLILADFVYLLSPYSVPNPLTKYFWGIPTGKIVLGSLTPLSVGILGGGRLFRLLRTLSKVFELGAGTSKRRGNSADDMLKKITEDEFSIERKKEESEYDGAELDKEDEERKKSLLVFALIIVFAAFFFYAGSLSKWYGWILQGISAIIILLFVGRLYKYSRKPYYTYLNFIQEGNDVEINKEPFFRTYIFGHTHVAGLARDKDRNLRIYNTGTWAQKKEGDQEHESKTFVLIDANQQKKENRIGVYRYAGNDRLCRMDEEGKWQDFSITRGRM